MRLQRPDIHTAARPGNSRPSRRGLDASPDFRTLFRCSGRRIEWLLGAVPAPDFPDHIYFCRTLGVLRLSLKPGTRRERTVVMLAAFLMSSMLHASSILTLWSETRPWLDVRFFLLQPVGIWLQGLVQGALGWRYREKWEVRWTANAVTSLLWFWAMMPLLAEGLAAGGV